MVLIVLVEYSEYNFFYRKIKLDPGSTLEKNKKGVIIYQLRRFGRR